MELSTEIKQARQRLGLSQSQAAKAWGVPLRTLQAWEQGTNSPRGFALKHLRQLLDGVIAARSPAAETAAGKANLNAAPSSRHRRKPAKDPS